MPKKRSLFVCCGLCFWQLVGVFADTDVVKSVTEGDSVTLESGVAEIQKEDIIVWRFNNSETHIAYINKEDEIFNTSQGAGFKDRLRLNNQTGSLTIMNTRTTDSGLYQINIKASRETTKRFNITVYVPVPQSSTQSPSQSTPQSPSQSSSSHSTESVPLYPNSALLISVAAAVAGALLTVAAVGMIWIYRKHRKTDQEETVQTREEEITYADPIFYKRNVQKSEDEVVYAGVVTRR